MKRENGLDVELGRMMNARVSKISFLEEGEGM